MRLFLLLFLCLGCFSLYAQPDSTGVDSIKADTAFVSVDTLPSLPAENYFTSLYKVLRQNVYLRTEGKPAAVFVTEKKVVDKNFIFYAICIVVFYFALLKTFYSRYFNNIFRVFFNTSLRQNQITDQLLQAKLPSLLFNIFFVLTGGLYIFLLLLHLGHIHASDDIKVLLICIAVLTIIYTGKYIVLKFTGWISGYSNEADTYIFIIFLINKIIAILLLPVVIIIAFSDESLVRFVVILSYIVIMLMLVSRFFRSYGILQNKIHVQRLHFFLYIIGVEILPLLLIYRSTLNLLTNN